MEASEANRPKDLEAENARLKKLLAEGMLDMEALEIVGQRDALAHKPSAKQ